MGRQMNRWAGGWMDEQEDGQMGRWMDRWVGG
ncbi:hypothetical protein LEMLEM_LOCUS12201 [Lemmus lemmus]